MGSNNYLHRRRLYFLTDYMSENCCRWLIWKMLAIQDAWIYHRLKSPIRHSSNLRVLILPAYPNLSRAPLFYPFTWIYIGFKCHFWLYIKCGTDMSSGSERHDSQNSTIVLFVASKCQSNLFERRFIANYSPWRNGWSSLTTCYNGRAWDGCGSHDLFFRKVM